MFEQFYAAVGETASVLCGLSLILFAGFLVTRLTNRLGMPRVSGYILAGVLVLAGVIPGRGAVSGKEIHDNHSDI